MSRTLLVTNDFPPRRGGMQTFVHGMALRLPSDDLVVYTSTSPGAAEFDAAQPFAVVRDRAAMLLPTPRVARAVADLAREHRCDRVWFGAAAPLGLLAAGLKHDTGIERAIALTHGHEVGWAMMPGTRGALRRIAGSLDVMTYLGDYTHRRIAPVAGHLTRLEQLTFGIDAETFHPGVDGSAVRERHGLAGLPVIVCVSRLVPRKGQDMLIAALPHVREQVGRTCGSSSSAKAPTRRGCAPWHASTGSSEQVVFTGGVPECRAGRALRGRGRLRDAVPHPAPRPRRGRARRGVPRGGRFRAAGDRRRLGRGAGHGAARPVRLGGRRP